VIDREDFMKLFVKDRYIPEFFLFKPADSKNKIRAEIIVPGYGSIL
jgi:hypothetical protein